MENKKSVFEVLNSINCNEHTEKKNGLTYLSWAWAWQIVKKNFPEAFYTIYENIEGWNYFTDGITAWVKTGVTIEGLELIEMLPVMDFRNNSIPVDKLTSFDVNKAIQRSLTKACARHGLGLYIYAGEDLPDTDDGKQPAQQDDQPVPAVKARRAARRIVTKPMEDDIPYKPLDDETYMKFIASEARGVMCPSGLTARERWCKMTHAKEGHLMEFDHAVEKYRAENHI